jgi:hypothetical protein
MLGLWDTGHADELGLRVLALFPEALSDLNTWWEVPRVLRVAAALAESCAFDRCGDGTRNALRRLLQVAEQRPDCLEEARRLRLQVVV